MKRISKYSKFIPYLYFIIITSYLFTNINKSAGIIAYPILLLSIPFIWQLIKPSKQLNFSLGTIFVCLSSYLIIVYLSGTLDLFTLSKRLQPILKIGGFVIISNFIMSLWMIRNSLKKAF